MVAIGWLLSVAAGALLTAGAVGGICIYGQLQPSVAGWPPPQISRQPPPPADDRPQRPDPARRIVIAGDEYHQFWGYATFTGPRGTARFQCLYDTGDGVTNLSKIMASRLGYDVNRLNFSIETWTANGPSRSALVRLSFLTLADRYTVRDEPAWVSAGDSECLIGMSTMHFLDIEKPKNGPLTLSW